MLAALLEPVSEGGGERSRGEIGQEGELGPDFVSLSFLPASAAPSLVTGRVAGLCVAIALCTAAAEGMPAKEPVIRAMREGLRSVLFFLRLILGAPAAVISVGRTGEPSREDLVVALKGSCGLGCVDVEPLSALLGEDSLAACESGATNSVALLPVSNICDCGAGTCASFVCVEEDIVSNL